MEEIDILKILYTDIKRIDCSREFEVILEKTFQIEIVHNKKTDEEFFFMAENYYEAGEVIVTAIYNDSNFNFNLLDIYFFPIAFIFRHSLELCLKAIILKTKNSEQEKKVLLNDVSHDLLKILKEIINDPTQKINLECDEIKWLTSYFNSISEIDIKSDSFRYPFAICREKDWFDNVNYKVKTVFKEKISLDLLLFLEKIEIVFNILKNIYLEEKNTNKDYNKFIPTFIESGGDYFSRCDIGSDYNLFEFHPYTRSYVDLAKILYHISVLDKNKIKKSLFFPMCYLYRNSIELLLKEILIEETEIENQDALEHIYNCKHKILKLWDKVKNDIIIHANILGDEEENKKTIIIIEKYLNIINNFDGDSTKFRYPCNKEVQHYFKNIKKLDIKNVNNFFEELTTFFDGVLMMMSSQNECKLEMDSYYSNY